MPRKGEVPKRKVLPDPKYTDAPADVRRRMTKFINVVMRDGKKSTAEHIVYRALDLVRANAAALARARCSSMRARKPRSSTVSPASDAISSVRSMGTP